MSGAISYAIRILVTFTGSCGKLPGSAGSSARLDKPGQYLCEGP